LKIDGFELSIPRAQNGETGVDLIAQKGDKKYFIEVIGFKKWKSIRAKDFFEAFFRAVSRIKDGAKNIIIALPERFGDGLNQRASQYGVAWERLGTAFPELEIWLVHCDQPYSYTQTKWNKWLTHID
jgi:hypothetical protein